MRDTLVTLCEDFITNRDEVKKALKLESDYIYPVCAAVFTDKKQKADVEKIKRCKEILKEQTGLFSSFRSDAKPALIAMLAAEENPDEKMRKALKVYGFMKEHFSASAYLPLAAMILAGVAEESQYEELAARTGRIYKLMKKEHPFLTSSEDSTFAGMLALSEMSETQIVEETEACYSLMKKEFSSANAVQSLSHVLALCEGTAEEKCNRTKELYEKLKAKGHKYGTGYELATLGVLAAIPADLDRIVDDMIEVDRFLAEQKGYGVLGVGKKQRLMHAGMLVTSEYMENGENNVMNSVALSSTISMIVAQQVAMCAAIAASSAAAASSSN